MSSSYVTRLAASALAVAVAKRQTPRTPRRQGRQEDRCGKTNRTSARIDTASGKSFPSLLIPLAPVLRGEGSGVRGSSHSMIARQDKRPLTPALSPGVPGAREDWGHPSDTQWLNMN